MAVRLLVTYSSRNVWCRRAEKADIVWMSLFYWLLSFRNARVSGHRIVDNCFTSLLRVFLSLITLIPQRSCRVVQLVTERLLTIEVDTLVIEIVDNYNRYQCTGCYVLTPYPMVSKWRNSLFIPAGIIIKYKLYCTCLTARDRFLEMTVLVCPKCP
jgi:hypothetical protein